MTQRHDWSDLPKAVRDAVGRRCGGVKAVTPISVGVNSAVACKLDAGDGAVFLKGLRTSDDHAWMYRNELAAAEQGAPGPELLWALDVDDWAVAAWKHIEGRHADLAPGSSDLDLIAAALGELAVLPAIEPDNSLVPEAERWERMRPWARLAASPPEHLDPRIRANLGAFADGEDAALAALAGDRLAHTDIHSYNVLVDGDKAHLIDWAWARVGAAWLDAEMFAFRLVTAGHSCRDADRWRRRNLPHPDLSAETRHAFAIEMLGTWLLLSIRRPERTLLRGFAEHAMRWESYLRD